MEYVFERPELKKKIAQVREIETLSIYMLERINLGEISSTPSVDSAAGCRWRNGQGWCQGFLSCLGGSQMPSTETRLPSALHGLQNVPPDTHLCEVVWQTSDWLRQLLWPPFSVCWDEHCIYSAPEKTRSCCILLMHGDHHLPQLLGWIKIGRLGETLSRKLTLHTECDSRIWFIIFFCAFKKVDLRCVLKKYNRGVVTPGVQCLSVREETPKSVFPNNSELITYSPDTQ